MLCMCTLQISMHAYLARVKMVVGVLTRDKLFSAAAKEISKD